MISNEWFGVEEKDFGKFPTKGLNSRKHGLEGEQVEPVALWAQEGKQAVFFFLFIILFFFYFKKTYFQRQFKSFLILIKSTHHSKSNAPAWMHIHVAMSYDEF
jgi:hypothetical protein